MSETVTTPGLYSHPECEFCNWAAISKAASVAGVEVKLERVHGVRYYDRLIVTFPNGKIWTTVDPLKGTSYISAMALLSGYRMARS